MNKRGAGWVVAATGGFAIWLLTYFLLPKPAQPVLPPNAVTVSLPAGTTFANAAQIISQQDQAAVEFVGFSDTARKAIVVNNKLAASDYKGVLENLRSAVANPESFPSYVVLTNTRGKYILKTTE